MKKIYCLILAAAIIALGTVHLFAEPGDGDDPLITLSYINEVLMPGIRNMIGESSPNSFKVLEMEAGDKLVCAAGTELILRMGNATVNATQKGGIADVTSATDLQDGSDVPSNSHLIVPVGDGRGITAKDKVIVMVKGSYTFQK